MGGDEKGNESDWRKRKVTIVMGGKRLGKAKEI